MEESRFIRHTACEACGSKNNRAEYSNGTSYCFGCEDWQKGTSEGSEYTSPKRAANMLNGEYREITKRAIPEEIARKYGYSLGVDANGVRCQIANYYDDEKKNVAQKLRYADKQFKAVGDMRTCNLFGQQLWGNGKKLTITEGEIDCLSVATAFEGKYPVVSLKGGAKSAKKELSERLEWLDSFEELYLWMDNDDVGNAAVESLTEVLPAHKLFIIRHAEYKDANELLVAEGKSAVVKAFYNATKYKPDDICTPDDLIESLATPIEIGFSYMFDGLTRELYGRREGEVVVLGAGVGSGKTAFVLQQAAHDMVQGKTVGLFMLEQTTKETVMRLAGKIDNTNYHLPNAEYDVAKLQDTARSLSGKVYLYDSFGSNSWEVIASKIRYMKHNFNVSTFYLDNLTALNAHAEDERRNLDGLMADIAGLAKELGIWILVVSHLNPPKQGTSHEKGGKTDAGQLTGSRSIMRWADVIVGLERNSLNEDEDERNHGLLRVLKDRFSGSATGKTIGFHYDTETGKLNETNIGYELAKGGKDETNYSNDF